MAGKGGAKAARQVAAADSVPPSNNVSADAVKTIVKPPGVTAFRPRVPAPTLDGGGSPEPGSSAGGSPGSTGGAATPSPGRIANAASRLQAQLSQFTEGLARTDAMLLAGTEELTRSTERQSKSAYDFTGSMLGMVRDSHANVSAAKTRVQAQRKAFNDLNAERDSLRVEKESLAHAVEDAAARLADKDAELEVVNESRRILEKEVDAKAKRLAQTEAKVESLNDQNAQLGAQIAAKEREVNDAEARRRELSARHEELERTLAAAQLARDRASAKATALEEANAALEEEIAAGEEAVLALQRQTEESFSALQADREALLARNDALQRQMRESQAKLDAVREEAAAIIAEEQGRTEELEAAYEETLLELEEKGGEGTLRPMLVEAQNREREALDRVEELERKLRELRTTRG